jgi:hypothetical protein
LSARLTSLLLISCCTLAAGASDSTSTVPKDRFVSDHGFFAIVLRSSPAVIPLNDLFALTMEVRPTSKVPTSEPLELSMAATMPSHQHGMITQPQVTALGQDRFRIEGLLLHMAGEWELLFDIRAGALHDQARTTFRLE